MGIEAGLARELKVGVAAVTGHGDQGRVLQARIATEAAGDFVAVQTGQADIQERGVGKIDVGGFKSVRSGVGGFDVETGRSEQFRQNLGRIDVVVDHEHAPLLQTSGGRCRGSRGGGKIGRS